MSKSKTLRVTEFKGLNKATNPHNIDDKELVELTNMFVTKNRGLESRKGYRRTGDADIVSNNNFIKSIFTTAWSKTDDRLYYVGNGFLAKMDADGTDTYLTAIDPWGHSAQFNRYKDKVLFLNQTSYLNWFNADEELSLVKYPELKADIDTVGPSVVVSAGGDLDVDTYYQYCIALVLGDDYLDGQSQASLPATQGTFLSMHPNELTTDTNKTISGIDVKFSGALNGFNVGYIKLYRREAAGQMLRLTGIGSWRLIDSAYVDLDVAAGTYSFASSDLGVVTDITGTLTDDAATFLIDFTDDSCDTDDLQFGKNVNRCMVMTSCTVTLTELEKYTAAAARCMKEGL